MNEYREIKLKVKLVIKRDVCLHVFLVSSDISQMPFSCKSRQLGRCSAEIQQTVDDSAVGSVLQSELIHGFLASVYISR